MINWKVRLKNPLFWFAILAAVSAPMFTAAGVEWEDMTSWAILWETIVSAVMNPFVVGCMVVAVYGVVNDWTTDGFGDSAQALAYEEPKPKTEPKHAKEE